jgi:hypothetical protein
MKKNMLAMSFLAVSRLWAQTPEVVLSPVDHLYVPAGFDNNDNVELVVTGYFPNPCYARNKVEVDLKDSKINVKVTALYRGEEKSLMCPQMLVPYKEVITVGNLQGGDYEININNEDGNGLKDNMTVIEASSNSVDDHLYALVDYVAKDERTGEISITGYNFSDCIQLDKIEYLSNKKDTISVMPVMKKVSSFCPMKMVPYTHVITPPSETIKSDKMLLHVRTIDGKSINGIFEVR